MIPAAMRPLVPVLALAVAAALAGAFPAKAAGPAAWDPPALARALRIGGVVAIEALVDEDGVVRATNIVRSQPFLDDEAAQRVFAMRFPPTPGDTAAVATIHTLEVAFRMPPDEPQAGPWEETRCSETEFHLDVSPRADSTGRFAVVWQASGIKSQELFVILLTPDGVVVDTTGSWTPERFTGDPGTPGWPAWHKDGNALKDGTGGAFAFTVPARTWWDAGRVAVVALFRSGFDDQMVAWQRVWRVERDSVGALLVPDPRAVSCVAGPWARGR
jgi:TonB family protein